MANPGAQLVVFGGMKHRNARTNLFDEPEKLRNRRGRTLLIGCGREEPHRTLKQLGVSVLDPRIFLAGHGMPAEKPPRRSLAKRFLCRAQHFGFRTTHIRKQSMGSE